MPWALRIAPYSITPGHILGQDGFSAPFTVRRSRQCATASEYRFYPNVSDRLRAAHDRFLCQMSLCPVGVLVIQDEGGLLWPS